MLLCNLHMFLEIIELRGKTLKKNLINFGHCPKRGGGPAMWIRKFLNVNIINFENVDKPEGGVGQCG